MEIRGEADGDVVDVRFDTDESDPALSVADVVAELEGQDPTELKLIYDASDHVVDHLFSEPPSPQADVEIAFTSEGYRVTIHQDGHATFVHQSEWDGPIVAED